MNEKRIDPKAETSSSSGGSRKLRFVFFVAVIVTCLFLGKFFSMEQEPVRSFLSRFPLVLSGLLFVVIYVALTSVIWFGPKDILRIASAYAYGPYISTGLVWIGELVNVLILFSLSRLLGREYVAGKLNRRMKDVDDAIAHTGFFSVFFLKLFPIIPFRFLDLGFGLTKISLRRYFFISLLASPLRIFILQLFLSLGLETVMDPQAFSRYLVAHPHIFLLSFLYVMGSLVLVVVLKKRSRR